MKRGINKRMMIAVSSVLLLGVIIGIIVSKLINPLVKIVQYYADNAHDIRDLGELEDLSDIIVKATVLPDSVNVPEDSEKKGRTYTNIEIQTVYKGNVNPGDIINITEQYYYADNGKELHSFNGYLPSYVGEQYMFFLGAAAPGYGEQYFLTGAERGRYSERKIDSLTNKKFSTLNYTYLEDTPIYAAVRAEVLSKYF